MSDAPKRSSLDLFSAPTRAWFRQAFASPTDAQEQAWKPISAGDSTLLLAPTGSGKTLAAFLACIDRLMFSPPPADKARCRVLYVSPLKALAVDVERNLRAPLVGISNEAEKQGVSYHLPTVSMRSGDTAPNERARFQRRPSDIVVTTPESLYLLATSNAREALRSVETIIVDEIHALVPTKRGAHLALTLERIEALVGRRIQRIGLSATQRPLEEIAHFLGGAEPRRSSRKAKPTAHDLDEVAELPTRPKWRPVTIVDAGSRKNLELRIEVPVEDMSKIGEPVDIPSGPAAQGPVRASIWSAIHPRLLELVKANRSTIIFVNARRGAERLAASLNELAGETLVYAHHGSLARHQRMEIEDRLKAGEIRALVATSSLELGIDMGAVDLVVQIEAPPSVASGMQRIGRAGHQVGATSRGVVFPKFRGDLVACATVAKAMHAGEVESIRYPRNALDVLAQQVVAMASTDPWTVPELFATVRAAAPYAGLSTTAFEGVLDMLAGRYASDEFAELRPRITWDRVKDTITGREGAKRVAIINGGTIPDRGLYGVFLAGSERPVRVGELDEEMVHESRVGEVFLLGASSWRIEEITHDRVLVSPAPGQPGKMPFWRGDSVPRPLETGKAIGRLLRRLGELPRQVASDVLVREHDLDELAAQNLLQYLGDEKAVTQALPDDRTIVIERCRDELGDWRVCVLSPLGGQILAPWAMAITAKARAEPGLELETLWNNDGLVVRFAESDEPPDVSLLIPTAEEVEELVRVQLGASALFAAKFRESASRALLLPKRRPDRRAPLWQTRKRAADLLQVASGHPSFPMILEAYRECLRDVFDMPALVSVLKDIEKRDVRVVTVDAEKPSPFAAALLFGYVANYIYEGDAPLAERRAQALAIDQNQLRELLGDAELRELLDPEAIRDVETSMQLRDGRVKIRAADGVHDLLLRLGDLTMEELSRRCEAPERAAWVDELVRARRLVSVTIAQEIRLIPIEYAARYRDALGLVLPAGLPQVFLEKSADALGDVVLRYARTHGPFTSAEVASRYGLAASRIETVLHRLTAAGKLLEGAFRPGGTHTEWCDPEALATIRRRSLAKLRKEVEPVEAPVFGRFATRWHGVLKPRRGTDALLDAIERLEGVALPASIVEREILSARVHEYDPSDLDLLTAAGEVVWCGIEPLGQRDGRVALFLTDHLPQLWRAPAMDPKELSDRERKILEVLEKQGASFFATLNDLLGGGFPADTRDALWNLVWKGLVTNDSFGPLRQFTAPPLRERIPRSGVPFRSRRTLPSAAGGRWSLVGARVSHSPSATEWSLSMAQQLLARHGIVSRETVASESIRGGFSSVYDAYKVLEESGRIRRGYFVTGVGAAQFAQPAALEMLRSCRSAALDAEVVDLAATDPANPYGAMLPWPMKDAARTPARAVGAHVVLVDGQAAGYLARGGRELLLSIPEEEPDRSRVSAALAKRLADMAARSSRRTAVFVSQVDGMPAREHPFAKALSEAGFLATAQGYQVPRGYVVEEDAESYEAEEEAHAGG